MNALLKGLEKNFEKKLSLLAGKFSLGKKVCAFEWCLVESQKIYSVFWWEKSCILQMVFTRQKAKFNFDF